ncbi:MAG: hypothetical protein MHPSP_002447, partial [Paramarteilia canceri]
MLKDSLYIKTLEKLATFVSDFDIDFDIKSDQVNLLDFQSLVLPDIYQNLQSYKDIDLGNITKLIGNPLNITIIEFQGRNLHK